MRMLGTEALRLFRQDVFPSMRERVQESNDGTRETGALDFSPFRHCTHTFSIEPPPPPHPLQQMLTEMALLHWS